MNGLPYYKAYPRDFVEGTIGMPFEIKGAYRLILDLIYMQGGHLPDDAKYIAGLPDQLGEIPIIVASALETVEPDELRSVLARNAELRSAIAHRRLSEGEGKP